MKKTQQSFYITRFNDCDPLGHLNNSRYIDYMLNAREDHLREGYQISLPEFAKQGISWVVSNHEIQYVRPAVYNERICIRSELIEAKESYIMVEIVMYDEAVRQVKAVLWTVFTHINLKTGKRATHPADFQELVNSVAVDHVQISKGLKARVGELLAELRK